MKCCIQMYFSQSELKQKSNSFLLCPLLVESGHRRFLPDLVLCRKYWEKYLTHAEHLTGHCAGNASFHLSNILLHDSKKHQAHRWYNLDQKAKIQTHMSISKARTYLWHSVSGSASSTKRLVRENSAWYFRTMFKQGWCWVWWLWSPKYGLLSKRKFVGGALFWLLSFVWLTMILKCNFLSGKEFIVFWHLKEPLETFFITFAATQRDSVLVLLTQGFLSSLKRGYCQMECLQRSKQTVLNGCGDDRNVFRCSRISRKANGTTESVL